MNYRRARAEGGTYFFTVVTQKRREILCSEGNVELIKTAFKEVISTHPFRIDAFVLLPNHFHCVWTLPKNDDNFSMRMRLIKSHFSRRCEDREKTGVCDSRLQKKEQNIWQRRFWEHWVRDEKDYETHVNYIHFNPVKHGYVKAPKDWKYSSFHRHVKDGIYDIDWGAGVKFDAKIGNE